VNADKIYKLVHYQVFREAKKTGGKKKRGGTSRFDKNDYKLVQLLYGRKWVLGTGFIGLIDPAYSDTEDYVPVPVPNPMVPTNEPPPLVTDSPQQVTDARPPRQQLSLPQPKKGLQIESIWQYRAVLRSIHKRQVAQKVNSWVWEHIWTDSCYQLLKLAESRKQYMKALNYEENLPRDLPQRPYMLLHSTTGILRFESLEKAKLSDFLNLRVQTPTDPHPIDVMATQLSLGKFQYWTLLSVQS
jgi:hypothetical protein